MIQDYDKYTQQDQEVWRQLFERQEENIKWAASDAFVYGLETIKFVKDKIPRFDKTNEILKECTGWQLDVVPGLIDDDIFFKLMSNKHFPATTWLRKLEELDYLEEPDMFHDVYGHVPLLTNKPFTNFLMEISKIGCDFIHNAYAIELLSRIYWFTVEFGLIRENGKLKIYGAGIISSSGETVYSLGDKPKHLNYDVKQILSTPYRKDIFQDRYFIINSYEELYASVDEIRDQLTIMTEQELAK